MRAWSGVRRAGEAARGRERASERARGGRAGGRAERGADEERRSGPGTNERGPSLASARRGRASFAQATCRARTARDLFHGTHAARTHARTHARTRAHTRSFEFRTRGKPGQLPSVAHRERGPKRLRATARLLHHAAAGVCCVLETGFLTWLWFLTQIQPGRARPRAAADDSDARATPGAPHTPQGPRTRRGASRSRCVSESVSESEYPSQCTRVSMSESVYPSQYVRVRLSESIDPSQYI